MVIDVDYDSDAARHADVTADIPDQNESREVEHPRKSQQVVSPLHAQQPETSTFDVQANPETEVPHEPVPLEN